MPKKGNKKNAQLNGEYANHVRKFTKKRTAGKRRSQGKKDVDKRLGEETITPLVKVSPPKPWDEIFTILKIYGMPFDDLCNAMDEIQEKFHQPERKADHPYFNNELSTG